MSNLHFYHINTEFKKRVKYPNINITSSPMLKNKHSFIKIENNDIGTNSRKKNNIKVINKPLLQLKSTISKTIINTESTLSKTDEDDQDIKRFKFLLNKLLKNPKSKEIVMNEIKTVIDNEENIDKNNTQINNPSQEGFIINKKTLSFNVNTYKNLENYKLTSPAFKYKNLRLIKDKRKHSENRISINISSHNSRNDLHTMKSKTLVKSIEIPSLDLHTITSKHDFNNEFVSKADDFSPSWRDDCIKANILT
jgi:hypothetical protein